MFKNVRLSWFIAKVGARLQTQYGIDRQDWMFMCKDQQLWNTLSYAKDAGFNPDETADMVVAGFAKMVRRMNEEAWG